MLLILHDVFWDSCICVMMSSIKFGNILAIISSNVSSACSFSLLLQRFHVRTFDIVPQLMGAVFCFFHPTLFLFFSLYNFFWLIFRFVDSCPCCGESNDKPIKGFLYLSLYISIWCFLIVSLFLLKLLIDYAWYSHFSIVCHILLIIISNILIIYHLCHISVWFYWLLSLLTEHCWGFFLLCLFAFASLWVSKLLVKIWASCVDSRDWGR